MSKPKIINHDIRNCGPKSLCLSELYSSRALCISEPGDIIQLSDKLKKQWPTILAHYQRIGLSVTSKVIWGLRLEETLNYPNYEPSVFYFSGRENSFWPNQERYQITQLLNSKNKFIEYAIALDVPVPLTYCFNNAADIRSDQLNGLSYPCYVKPAISLSGLGIYKCENIAEIQHILSILSPNTPMQIQDEIKADCFANVQYVIKNGILERFLVSEQIMEGNSHIGNRAPSNFDSFELIDNLAKQIHQQGMQDFFAFDVAVTNPGQSNSFFLIECNPRFNAATYPALIAKKLGISEWSTITLKTAQRDLAAINIEDIEYNSKNKKGLIIINWGTILDGKLMVMLVGNNQDQLNILAEFKNRVSFIGRDNMKSTVLLSIKEMERITAGKWRNISDKIEITGANFYLPLVESGDLFFHRQQDNPEYIEDSILQKAFAKGAVAAVVRKDKQVAAQYPLLEVDNVLKALQDLALASSLKFDGIRILVTGSHGKTGFKTQLYHAIKQQIKTHAHLDSYNLQAPIWKTLTAIPKDCNVAIIETAVPVDGIGEDRSLFIRPNYCVITGIGLEHLSSHRTIENLIKNKASVVTGLKPGGKCILNADDVYFNELKIAVKNYSNCEVLSFGSSSGCEGKLVGAEYNNFEWDVVAAIMGETVRYKLPLIEDYAPLASVGVLLMAKLLNANLKLSASQYINYKNYESSGNLYKIRLNNFPVYIYDQSRRGEWKGFESMFELMSRLEPENKGRKIAILSELINLDDNKNAPIDLEKMRLKFEKAKVDILYTIHDFKEHSIIVSPNTKWSQHGKDIYEIEDSLISSIQPHDMIFVRGIESARLDILVNKLISLGDHIEKIY